MAKDSKALENVPSRTGSTQKMGANIQVVVRVRPPNPREVNSNSRMVVEIVDDRMLVFDPKEDQRLFFYQGVQQPNRNYLKRANKELKFVFDSVFGQNSDNKDVFETTTKEMLSSLMEGYNCSVFAYGATGAGKTFTMIGNQENPGITFLTMEHLFYSIGTFENEREFDIGVSYIEVYNENVFDLLNPSKHALQLREDAHYGVMVAGLTLHKIKTAPELLNMLESGNRNRTQHPTDANAESSRSHAVFQVYITMKYKITGQVRMVKLSMIDLAGSERACATGCVRERFKEGANINRSLLALGNVINTLADGGKYVPYRDSKLTRLLKDSLGGNCKTVMIANVSPSHLSYEDTYNTLKYAARANKIQLSVKKTVVNSDMRMSAYVDMIEQLKKKVKELETKLSTHSTQSISKERDTAKDRAKFDWIRRIKSEERKHVALETQLLQHMSMARVLALRHRNKTRALDNVANLAHRSSSEAVEQLYSEDLPRQERSAENYNKHSATLDAKIMSAWTEWRESRDRLQNLCDTALADCPELVHFIDTVHMRSEVRKTKAENELKDKLLAIEIDEIDAFTKYTSDMPKLLKKLYLTIKGYDKVTPALTEEYVSVMRKSKASRNITWSDNDTALNKDTHLKFITTIDLEKPSSIPDLGIKHIKEEYHTIEIDSEELTDTENKESLNRKATPMKKKHEETILIEDSFEQLDVTKNLSAKKPKRDFGKISPDFDNFNAIDAKDLNSTFVLAGKVGKNVKFETGKVLTDTTNMMTRSDIDIRSKPMVPPSLTRSLSARRPLTAPPLRTAAFGTTLSRDARPKVFGANGLKTNNNKFERIPGMRA